MKKVCTFTVPKELNSNCCGIFYAYKSGYQIPVHCNNTVTGSFGEEKGGDSLSYLPNTIFTYKMPKEVKITPKLKNSKLKRTPVARKATLTLTGCRNPYLFCIRKIFRDFLEEERKGGVCSEYRLAHKIECESVCFRKNAKH